MSTKAKATPSRAIEATAFYTPAEVARLLSMHVDTARRLIRIGSIQATKRFGDPRVMGAELLRVAEGRRS